MSNDTYSPSLKAMPGHRGIRIRKLRLHGTNRFYDVDFRERDSSAIRSLSVIAGAFSTGKTTVLEFIDYCLGGSDHPRHPEVMRKIRAATLEVELSGITHLIERTVGEPSTHAFVRQGHLDDGGGPPAERRPIRPPGNADSLSSLLLAHCGLEGVELREAPTQASSDTDPLSFRNLMWLCFLPNEQLASKNLLFESNPHKRIKLKQVVDVIFDVHDDRVAEWGRRLKEMENRLSRARTAYLAAQQLVEEQQLGGRMELEMLRAHAQEELAATEATLRNLDERARAGTNFASELRQRHRDAATKARRAAAVLRDRETQLQRMAPLRAQYADDVAKLTMLAEARTLFDPLRVRVCPACLHRLARPVEITEGICSLCHHPVPAHISELSLTQTTSPAPNMDKNPHSNGHRTISDNSEISQEAEILHIPFEENIGIEEIIDVSTELRATKARLSEITRFVEELDSSLSELRSIVKEAEAAEAAAAYEVDVATTASISPFLVERDALGRRRQDAAADLQRAASGLQMIASLERRANDLARQEAAVKALREEIGDATTTRPDRTAIVRQISDRYYNILAAWKYPKLADAYLAEDLTPFMRGNRYIAASSGGRTLISLAWTLAIFEIAWETGGSHPGFLMLDSPQKNLGQTGIRDDEFADAVTVDDIYRHLHAWLAGPGSGAQLLIADNAPPARADDDVIIRFSRRVDQPPYGLIDDETG
ncbi:hypothetical protein [Streptosporangium roseum]|uniref:hypothetical protein n=1 Tax=Streptosporangium roseum TaxID=2001 RepID=UPI000A428BB0|nr:hypothetical protein [Streptosporangium roseum]